MVELLAAAIGFTSLTPGIAVVDLQGIGVQPIVVFLSLYVGLLPLFMRRLPLQPLLWVALTFVSYAASTALSVWPAFSVRFSFLQGIYLTLGALGFMTILSISRHRRAFARGYVAGALVSSLVGLGQVAYSFVFGGAILFANNTNFSLVPAYGRAAAFTPESSMLAALLTPAVLCCWFERSAAGPSLLARWQRNWAVLALLVLGLIATKSSSAMYFPLLIVIASAFCSRSATDFVVRNLKLVLPIVAAALVFVPLYASRLADNDAPASKSWRLAKIETGMRIFLAHPVFGAGPGMVSDADYFGPLIDVPPELSWDSDSPKGVDSTAVRVLAETGIVGFAIVYYPLVVFFRRTRQLARSSAFRAIVTMGLGLLFSQFFISGYRDQIIFSLPLVAFAVAGGVRALLAHGPTTRLTSVPGFTLAPQSQLH